MSLRILSKCGCLSLLLLCWTSLGRAALGPQVYGNPIACGSWALGETNVPPSLTNVVAVAAGYHFSLALKADGTVTGWGASSGGQISPPAGLNSVVAIAAGYAHGLALKSNGTVVAWGQNDSGQLNIPGGLIGIKAIAAGHYHNLALASNGVVYAWGGNSYGQATVPPIYYEITAIAAGGYHSLALMSSAGSQRIVAWGQNADGQLNVSNYNSISAIGAGDNFSLLVQNGGVIRIGNPNNVLLEPPPGLSGVVSVAGGGAHCAAMLAGGGFALWGDNTSGQLNMPTGTLALAVSPGATHTVALKVVPAGIATQPQDATNSVGGSVTFSVGATGSPPLYYLWYKGTNALSSARGASLTLGPLQPSDAGWYRVLVWNGFNGLTCVTSRWVNLTVLSSPYITAQPPSGEAPVGATVVFSVGAAGTTPLYYQWRFNGTNLSGATSPTYTINNVQLTHSGNYCVVVWNSYGAVTSQVAVLTVRQLPIILTQPHSQTVLLGTAVNMGIEANYATYYQWRKNGEPIPGANGPIYAIPSAQGTNGGAYSVAVSNAYGGLLSSTAWLSVITLPAGTNGLLVGWGERWIWNGSNAWIDLNPPGGLEATKIANGLSHSLGLSTGGLVVGWGDNSYGQAGAPPSLDNAVDIAAGNYHSLARTATGSVVAWGKNDYGQIDVPPSLSAVVAIAAGANHSLALKSDGTIVGWGNSSDGQTIPSPGVGNANFMAIAAGENHSLGVRSNYTVGAWGANNYKQCQVPAGLSGVKAVAAGQNHSMALRTNGTVIVWGDNTYGQTNVPPGLSNVIAIACGANHCVALKRGGVTVSWGHDNWGQTPSPQDLAGVLAVSAKGDHTLFLKRIVLRMNEIHHLPNGNYRLLLKNEDGTAINDATFAKTQILVSTNPTLNVTNWVPLTTNIWLINGTIQVEDTRTNLLQRYYMSLQNP